MISEGCEPGLLLAAHAEAFERWSNDFKGFSAVILPHDYRPQHRELEICEAFFHKLPTLLKERTLLVRECLSAAEAKAVATQCDLMLNLGRMHLAIAVLGSIKSVACLGYQNKFEGLLAHFGLEELVLPWRNAIAPGRLAGWGGEILRRHTLLASQVAAKLPAVLALSRANLNMKARRSTPPVS